MAKLNLSRERLETPLALCPLATHNAPVSAWPPETANALFALFAVKQGCVGEVVVERALTQTEPGQSLRDLHRCQ